MEHATLVCVRGLYRLYTLYSASIGVLLYALAVFETYCSISAQCLFAAGVVLWFIDTVF